jgi:unsaturated rhamnogalacturonyl hydrolase
MAENRQLIERVCERTLKLAFQYSVEDAADPASLRWGRWDWQIGVAFYGAWKAYELLGDESVANRIKAWIDTRIDQRIDSININTTAPLLTVANLARKYGETRYDQLLRFFDIYLAYFGLRTPCGALSHTVIGKHRPDQIWADTLFMAILYLVKRGLELPNENYLREAIRQIELHGQHLKDPESGLFYHGWHDVEKRFMGVKWGRGNCWITAGMAEILELLDFDLPERAGFLKRLNDQVAALAKLQRPDGLWHTVLDDPTTYPESSVTAGVAYGVLKGIRLGYLDPQYRPMAVKAIEALVSKIDAQGNVTLGSGGTPIFATVADYNKVPYEVTPFTQGLALMALCEAELHQPLK